MRIRREDYESHDELFYWSGCKYVWEDSRFDIASGVKRIEDVDCNEQWEAPIVMVRDDSIRLNRIIPSERPVSRCGTRRMELMLWGNGVAWTKLENAIDQWKGKVAGRLEPADLLLRGLFDDILFPGSVALCFVYKEGEGFGVSACIPSSLAYIKIEEETWTDRAQAIREIRNTFVKGLDLVASEK